MSIYFARRGVLVLLLSIAAGTAALAQNDNRRANRFAAMDANGDGVITRREWRGNDRSFEVQDWNRDGILSGDEVRPGARRRAGDTQATPGSAGRYAYDDWTTTGFSTLDRNRDQRVSRDEWQSDAETFRRVDGNGDGVLSRAEFLGDANQARTADDSQGRTIDTTQGRYLDERFESVDTNNDGRVSRGEWRGTAERFNTLDENRDSVLTRAEFGTPRQARSEAWQQGYTRGVAEGRQAGKEDKQLRNQWDLEGQRELETADSGYEARLGVRAQYQEGYREGFRAGYREGFGPR
jgi:hypothetical protein